MRDIGVLTSDNDDILRFQRKIGTPVIPTLLGRPER